MQVTAVVSPAELQALGSCEAICSAVGREENTPGDSGYELNVLACSLAPAPAGDTAVGASVVCTVWEGQPCM